MLWTHGSLMSINHNNCIIALFKCLPEVILSSIFLEYIHHVIDISSFGSVCVEVSNGAAFKSLWKMLYMRDPRMCSAEFRRSTRASSQFQEQPRIKYFNSHRFSRKWREASSLMRARNAIDHSDSPKSLKKCDLKELRPFQLEELLIHAAYQYRDKCVRFLLTEYELNINSICYQSTLLIITAWQGNVNLLKWILKFKGSELDFSFKGVLLQSSACGGKGPYSALEWAERKAAACPLNTSFIDCVNLIRKDMNSRLSKN